MPGDQAPDDAMSACFDTAPLPAGMDLLGAATLHLTLSSDQPRAHLVARLCDVAPDGTSARIAHGILNLCHRDDPARPCDVPTGTPITITLNLDHCAQRLAPGHRLRLALSTTCWPFLWPAPRPATLTLHRGALTLPVHQGSAGDEWAFPPPHVPHTASQTPLSPPKATRRIEHDLISGEASLLIEDHTGTQAIGPRGRQTTEARTERWTIHPDDPLSARAQIDWHQHHAQGDLVITTDAHVTMTSSPSHLRMTATLVAHENGTEILRRTWEDDVPRLWA